MKRKWKSILVLGLPYGLSVLLPILATLLLGRMVSTSYHENIISDKQKSIETAFERFQSRIEDIEKTAQMIAQNDMVVNYTYASLRGEEHSLEENIQMRDILNGYMNNSDVAAIFFYDSTNGRIIATDAVLSDARDYFKYRYQMEGSTPEESLERLRGLNWGYEYSANRKVTLDGRSMRIIEYVVSVPLNMTRHIQPHLIMIMETEEIFGDFYDILEADSEFYIYNNGELIFCSDGKYKEVAGTMGLSDLRETGSGSETIYYMSARSDNRSWSYEFFMPNLLKGESRDVISDHVWLLSSIPVMISMVICIYFTFRNHREFQEVLNLLKGHDHTDTGEEAVGYKAIREYANRVMNDNERFRERLTKYDSGYKQVVLDKLLRNAYTSREESEKALAETGVCIGAETCLVMVFRYEDASYRTIVEEDTVLRDLVKEFLLNSIDGKTEIFDTSARETVCIWAVEEHNLEVCVRDLLSRLNVEIVYSYGINLKIGVGNVVDSIFRIGNSYMQAKEVIRYGEISESRLLFFSELEVLEDLYYFPRETGEKLYNNVVAGRVESAQEIIKTLYTANFEQNSRLLSVNAIEILKSRLRDAIISIAVKYGICVDSQIQMLHKEQNIKRYFELVCDVLEGVAGEIRKQGVSMQNNTVQKIVNYVQENFCDSALSLKQISQQLGLHENYISKVFKEERGENLSAVIEKLRIEKAMALIRNTDLKIGDIAQQVGYTSDLSFRRAFKKITGVNPGEFRENV